MTALRDILLWLVVVGLPVYLVMRGGWRGSLAAALIMWIAVYLAGEIQRSGGPAAERFGMALWLVIGLPVSLGCCGVLYGFRQLALFVAVRAGNAAATKVKYRK